MWHDVQIYDSERLLLSVIMSAENAGADVANYVRSTKLVHDGTAVTGLIVEDYVVRRGG